MADRLRNCLLREESVTYGYILLYIALSSGQIFFNKVIPPLKSLLHFQFLSLVFARYVCMNVLE